MKIAILGAESTGKSQLAGELAGALRSQGRSVSLVGEYLREWCSVNGRTPRADEQALIAHEQVRRVEAADVHPPTAIQSAIQNNNPIANHIASQVANRATNHATNHVLLADTTALMTAVYSELLFQDGSLHDFAIAHQRSYDITLLTGLDLPWMADGLLRDGPHTQEAADSLLRAVLGRASLAYQVVYGKGPARLENALRAIHAMDPIKAITDALKIDATQSIATYSQGTGARALFSSQKQEKSAKTAVWTWPCDKCSDPECEHRLFTRLSR